MSPPRLYPGWVNIGWKRWVRIRWKSTFFAQALLEAHRSHLELLTKELLRQEVIEAEEFAPGTVLELSRGVTFAPADGWSSADVPKPGAPSLTIFRDAVTFTISVGEFEGSPQDLLDELVDEYEGDFKVKGDPQTFALGEALRGAGVSITTEEVIFGGGQNACAGTSNWIAARVRQPASTPRRP